jgi:hypothetical protein
MPRAAPGSFENCNAPGPAIYAKRTLVRYIFSMAVVQVRDWPRHELRLVFFDFSVRGLGDTYVVRAVLNEWGRLGGLTPGEVEYWNDALDWRELGGSLPGWRHPTHVPGLALRPAGTESDARQFHAWRSTRHLRSSAV